MKQLFQFTSSFLKCFAEIYTSTYFCIYIYQYTFLYFFNFSILAKYIIPCFPPLANFTLTSLDRWQVFSCGFPTFLWTWSHIHKAVNEVTCLLTKQCIMKKKSYMAVSNCIQRTTQNPMPWTSTCFNQRGANFVIRSADYHRHLHVCVKTLNLRQRKGRFPLWSCSKILSPLRSQMLHVSIQS